MNDGMKIDEIVNKVTKSSLRKSLYHFTRARNLDSVAHLDALYSSIAADPALAHESRSSRIELQLHGRVFVANAHLQITDQVMDANTTQRQFQQHLDRHVFFWPTRRSCLKMLEMYSKREPDERFVVLQLDAEALLSDYFEDVKLSKYDSGSSPRYPARVSYKKSLRMFLPLQQFETIKESYLPTKPSEIYEVLVEGKVTNLSRYLQAIYCKRDTNIPESWRSNARSFEQFKD
ncbi:DUF7002 family protein [Paenibacillus albus]|uniref:DUF4433 domain-containing protein n=1 Tax=Paenibacillus albus TaxID=2495582 RepID=A0A3S9A6P1_9BACL|nr:hypothetical protein [Paenibacillus albus]AZN41395.1 hypothetical protein EJC50_18240 [Paenibacillus albus]